MELTAALPPGSDTAISGGRPASLVVLARLRQSAASGFVRIGSQAEADMAANSSATTEGPAVAMAAPLGIMRGRRHLDQGPAVQRRPGGDRRAPRRMSRGFLRAS